VKPAPFEYLDPRDVDEALEALARHGDEAKVLAGGQSLVPMLAMRLARPAVLVDVNRVTGLETLADRDGVLHVGATVRQRQMERWTRERLPLLAAGLALVGHAAIRNRGTVAGSVVHADPAAELPALLLCLDGSVVARRRDGERVIAGGDFFVGPLVTALAADELVTATRWPLPPAGAGWGFHEVARRHGDFALAGAAALVSLHGGRVREARVALFGAAATPRRLGRAEAVLAGQVPTPALLGEAARAGVEGLDAQEDLHASAAYRRSAARTLVARALADAATRAKDA
jgi:aerobic carbon-monoxide dehydrogenase medium subunit